MKMNDNKKRNTLGNGLGVGDIRLALPLSKEDEPLYRPMLQGAGTNDLSRIYLDKEPKQADMFTGKATIDYGDDFVLTLSDYKKGYKLVASTQKLFDIMAIAYTGQVGYRQTTPITKEQMTVSYPLKEYVRDLGKDPNNKTDLDNTRKAVKKDLENLFKVSINWKEHKKNGKDADFKDVRLISEKGIVNGNIEVQLTPRIAEYLANAYIMDYPSRLTAISCQQTPLPYYIGRKLALHHSMENNKKAGTANIIGVDTLVNHLTVGGILDTYEEVMSSNNRSPNRLIITPIEKALDLLVENGTLIDWCYCDTKKTKLTDSQLAEIQGNYSKMLEAYILFVMAGDEDIPLKERKEQE